jgi:nitronate monooxygenase
MTRPGRPFWKAIRTVPGVWFGEATGLIHAIEPAAAIVERMVADAAPQLSRHDDARIS